MCITWLFPKICDIIGQGDMARRFIAGFSTIYFAQDDRKSSTFSFVPE